MSEKKKYRVIQWATGVVGQAALKHFIENPTYEARRRAGLQRR